MNLRMIAGQALAFLAAVLVSGCGDGLIIVRGQVLFDNVPLENGSINFRPTEGTTGPTAGANIKDGAYQVPNGLARGTYAVEIRSWRKTGKQVASPVGTIEETVNAIPAFYWGEATTLRAHLQPGSGSVDFKLEKPNGPGKAGQGQGTRLN
jgi:hypothetical protein